MTDRLELRGDRAHDRHDRPISEGGIDRGERDPWQTEGGGVTEELLRALRIPYECLEDPSRVAGRVAHAQTLAYSSLKPVAVLLTRELMEEPL